MANQHTKSQEKEEKKPSTGNQNDHGVKPGDTDRTEAEDPKVHQAKSQAAREQDGSDPRPGHADNSNVEPKADEETTKDGVPQIKLGQGLPKSARQKQARKEVPFTVDNAERDEFEKLANGKRQFESISTSNVTGGRAALWSKIIKRYDLDPEKKYRYRSLDAVIDEV